MLFEDGKKQRLPEVKLVDSDAEEITVRTARYLAALGNSDHVISDIRTVRGVRLGR